MSTAQGRIRFTRFGQATSGFPRGAFLNWQPTVFSGFKLQSIITMYLKEVQNVESGSNKPEVVGEVVSSKSPGKCLRICTVLAYLLAVSSAAIMLSLYYLFIWVPEINE